MKRMLLKTLLIIAIGYLLICVLLYLFQEKLIFFPQKLATDYRFSFNQPFEELNVFGFEQQSIKHAA